LQLQNLLDTHILAWWLFEAKKLSRDQSRILRGVLQRNEPVAISAMTLLEIALLVSKRKIETAISNIFDAVESNPVFQILPVTIQVASEVASLETLVDPFDKAIVATARVHRLTLLTADERMIESGLIKTVS
jgi:PIN domain nuclease of toxin-antitoxin system